MFIVNNISLSLYLFLYSLSYNRQPQHEHLAALHSFFRPDIDALANITLFCRQHIKYKQLRLHDRELEKSVEVKVGARLQNAHIIHVLCVGAPQRGFWVGGRRPCTRFFGVPVRALAPMSVTE